MSHVTFHFYTPAQHTQLAARSTQHTSSSQLLTVDVAHRILLLETPSSQRDTAFSFSRTGRPQATLNCYRISRSMPRPNHIYVLSGCVLFGGTMFALPSILRVVVPHQVQRDKLTGSQRQRGMYMNAGIPVLNVSRFFTSQTTHERHFNLEYLSLAPCRCATCFVSICSVYHREYCPNFSPFLHLLRVFTISTVPNICISGSSDLGPDPDWDVKNSRWLGHDKK